MFQIFSCPLVVFICACIIVCDKLSVFCLQTLISSLSLSGFVHFFFYHWMFPNPHGWYGSVVLCEVKMDPQ